MLFMQMISLSDLISYELLTKHNNEGFTSYKTKNMISMIWALSHIVHYVLMPAADPKANLTSCM